MDTLHRLDDQLMRDVNDLARHTGWLHGAVLGFARVYIAAHYPWDVAAGLLFGALVALMGWLLLRRVLTSVTRWLRARPGLRQAFPASVELPVARERSTREAAAA